MTSRRVRLEQGPDDTVSNDQRADWAYRACQVFAQQTGQVMNANEAEEVIKDLITDLLHLAQSYSGDVEELHRSAFSMYEQEKG